MKILVSAGHTNVKGQDRGAVGSGYVEGVLATELRDAVAARLRELGQTVIEDGFDGVNDPLQKAIQLAKTADKAVEFHWNAGPPTATGIECLAKPKNKALAQKLSSAVHLATGLKLRGEIGYKPDNSGQHHRLGFIEAGGVILEICFISNAADMKAYKDAFESVVNNIAEALR